MTQNERLINYLNTGRPITAALARQKFGIKRLAARVNELREQGYCIYTNRTTRGTSYRAGRPSRNIVSLVYRSFGASAFSGE